MFFDKKLNLKVPENEDERFFMEMLEKGKLELKEYERQIKLTKLILEALERKLK